MLLRLPPSAILLRLRQGRCCARCASLIPKSVAISVEAVECVVPWSDRACWPVRALPRLTLTVNSPFLRRGTGRGRREPGVHSAARASTTGFARGRWPKGKWPKERRPAPTRILCDTSPLISRRLGQRWTPGRLVLTALSRLNNRQLNEIVRPEGPEHNCNCQLTDDERAANVGGWASCSDRPVHSAPDQPGKSPPRKRAADESKKG